MPYVSCSRIWPLRPWTTSWPGPSRFASAFAFSMASRCVENTRSNSSFWPSHFTAHWPSFRRTCTVFGIDVPYVLIVEHWVQDGVEDVPGNETGGPTFLFVQQAKPIVCSSSYNAVRPLGSGASSISFQ